MEKNIKDYLHYYLGCECVHTFVPEDHPQYDNGWRLVSIQSRSEKPYELDNGIHYTWTDSIKPKLRKLESMTEEELQERHFGSRNRFQYWLNHNQGAFPTDDLLWFLKNGFDVFDLIHEGLATEKQPTTQNQGV